MLDGVQDQGLVFLDGLGEADERLEAAASGPGDPAAQQGSGVGKIGGPEDRPKLLFEQVGPVEPCSVPKLSRGPLAWRFSAAQAIRRYSLITPPTTRSRRIGVSSGMTHAGSWLGGR